MGDGIVTERTIDDRPEGWRWIEAATKPPRRTRKPGANQLALIEPEHVGAETGGRVLWTCDIDGCNRTAGHPGPHRDYDRRTFTVRKEWGSPT
jgi:hypothetical protein